MDHSLVSEIASCIIAAWALAVIAQLFRQPLILAYLAAGVAVGPIGLAWIKGDEHINVISEIGLSLLLFMIGLEIDLKKMFKAGRAIFLTAGAQMFGGCLLGLLAFLAAGFSVKAGALDALYLAVAAALSSTVIIVKILHDKRELDTLAGRLTLGILVLQDLFAILFLAIQPNLQQASLLAIGWSLGKVAVLVAAAFLASRYLLPPLFKRMARVPELILVGALAWCFIMAGLASRLELSREMGALIAGVALSTFPYTLDVAAKVTSLRDFFVTLFFVALGMRIPAPTPGLLIGALLISLFVIFSRFVTVLPVLHRLKLGHRVSLLPSISLSQISEFSLVILVLGVQSNHISNHTLDLAAYAFAMLAVASSYAITKSDALVRKLSPWLTKAGILDLAETGTDARDHQAPARVMFLGFYTTASSLLAELERSQPAIVKEMAVVDFNPVVNERLRARGIRVIYGDISKRDTLAHAGADHAEVIVCTLPNSILKGTSNLQLVKQLREINPKSKLIVTSESFAEVAELYVAGADYVSVPRVTEAGELCTALAGALNGTLSAQRAHLDMRLKGRSEVVP